MKTTIVIPAFNEGKRIGKVLSKLDKYSYKIIVINDGSSDDTENVVKQFKRVKLINHKNNSGQGAALRTGIRAALKDKSDIIVTFDADGQHKASDIKKFITTIGIYRREHFVMIRLFYCKKHYKYLPFFL